MPLTDWSPAEFERHGHDVLAMLRAFFETLEERPVFDTTPPAEVLKALEAPVPQRPEAFDAILADTQRLIVPHLTQWNHPGFHAYFAISASGPGILAETATAAFNVNAMLWRTGPAASALETVVLRWLAELLGYPTDADGVLVNGASLASFYAIAAALDATGLEIREKGLAGRDLPRLRLYISDQTHSSLEKAAIALGIGLDNVVKVPVDEGYRLDPEALRSAIAADVAAGHRPVAVCANIGTTSTGSVDPLGPVAAVSREFDTWLHVDAAYGGFWRIVPGIDAATGDLGLGDSLLANPHKTLYTPLEATALFCRRKGALRGAFSLVPEYLRSESDPAAVNYMDRSLQLGRSFRALKIWWILRTFGVEGIRARMAEHVRLARQLEAWAWDDPDWWTGDYSPYPLVTLRATPAAWGDASTSANRERIDALNEAIMQRINEDGRAFLSRTVLREGFTIRVSIGNIRTEERHIRRLWDDLRRTAADLAGRQQ